MNTRNHTLYLYTQEAWEPGGAYRSHVGDNNRPVCPWESSFSTILQEWSPPHRNTRRGLSISKNYQVQVGKYIFLINLPVT